MGMKKNIAASLLILFPLWFLHSQHAPDTSFLTLIFAGDIMGHDDQIAAAYDPVTKTYIYETTFRYIKPYVKQADIAIANLEVTLAGPPYKGYPCFSSPDALAQAALDAGFDVLLTANNHCLDRNKQGLERTIDVLDNLPSIYTGTFKNDFHRKVTYPLIIEKNNIRIALLNYTYATNGIEVQPPNVVNYIDNDQIKKDIDKAHLAEPDYIIVTLHWGVEYERNENETQQQLAEDLLAYGADAIIASHPHVIQPIRTYYPEAADSANYKMVVYSLGNFVSNQRGRYKDGGIIFEMKLIKTNTTKIIDFNYLATWVHRKQTPSEDNFYIMPASAYYQNREIFNFSEYDKNKMETFYSDTRLHLKSIPENTFFLNYRYEE